MVLQPSRGSYLIELSYNTLGVSFYLPSPPPPSPPFYLACSELERFVSHGLDGLHNGSRENCSLTGSNPTTPTPHPLKSNCLRTIEETASGFSGKRDT